MQKTAGLLFANVVVSKKTVEDLQYKCSCCRRQLQLLLDIYDVIEKDAIERY
jgi:hypothetical protein